MNEFDQSVFTNDGNGPTTSLGTAVTEVSLIIPVFNSAASLHRLTEQITQFVKSPDFDVEIVFVDDASSDGSANALRDLVIHGADLVILELPINRGQSKATLAGMFAARHDIIVTLDDDLQHRPQDIPTLLSALMSAGPSTLVMGIADSVKRPLWRTLAGVCCNVISNFFLSKPLPLRLTTFCAFHRRLSAHIDANAERDVALITELAQVSDRILTVPVQSNSSMHRDSRYTLRALVRLFMSRSSCYSLSRVRLWLACGILSMAGSASLFAMRGGLGYSAIFLGSAVASSILILLAISVQRHARTRKSRAG